MIPFKPNCFCLKLAAVIHEDCHLCKCFHILTFVELNVRLFWFSINETKETAQSACFPSSRGRLRRSACIVWLNRLNLVKSISNTLRVKKKRKTETSTPVY